MLSYGKIRILYFLLLNFVNKINGNDVLGCGGYIKSKVPIEFSQVKVKLLTVQGSIKYETECFPNNGYYFIPVYDHGSYFLKVFPPLGWSFDPEEIELNIDGVTDKCSKNEDNNFHFQGFAIFGRVITSGSTEGPSEVTVALKQGKEEIMQVKTLENGDYSFSPLAVGNYEIVASHPKWNFLKNLVKVEILNKNGNAGSDIVIAGYSIKGSFQVSGKLISSTKVILMSTKTVAQNIACNRTKLKNFETQHKKLLYLCHTTVSEDGTYIFDNLPLAKYTIVPYIAGENSELNYNVQPTQFAVDLKHQDFTIDKSFEVLGRDVRGRIITGRNSKSGLVNAVVSIADGRSEMSDTDGFFTFKNLNFAQYRFKVETNAMIFEDVSVHVKADEPALVTIYPTRYQVCFYVSVDSGSDFNIPWSIEIKCTESESKIQTNSSGHACIHLPPNNYTAVVLLSPLDQEAGIRFGPAELKFNVESSPINELKFAQFLSEIHGIVQCLETCKALPVSLKPFKGSGGTSKSAITVQNKFLFTEVVPGDYELSIDKEEFCWKNQTFKISVNKKNVTAKFVQSGFKLSLTSTHETRLNYVTNHGHTGVLNISKGTSRECVAAAGKYVFSPVGCHHFGSAHLQWDTAAPHLLTLTAVSHLVTGRLKAAEPGPFEVTVSFEARKNDILALKLSEGSKYLFNFEAWAKDEVITLTPSSSTNLFQYSPPSYKVEVSDDCVLNVVEFVAERALFVKGNIDPPIKGIEIKVVSEINEELLYNTNSEGFFMAGPLNKSLQYTVTAQRIGYTITPTSHDVPKSSEIVKINFKAYKLAEISVFVTDENLDPLEGVLISTSGGEDYRQNSLTEKDGNFVFRALMPDDYFLRPFMKEYAFDPSSKMVKVESGATVDVKVIGKRIAYSIWGKTLSLSGEFEPDVVIEAVGIEGHCEGMQEEAISDQQGSFRIKGLKADCEYSLKMKRGERVNEHIERCLPKYTRIKMGSDDFKDVKLVVVRPFLQMDVSVVVDTKTEYLDSLTAEVYQDNAPDVPIHVVPLNNFAFFMLPPMIMDKKWYTIQLVSGLSREHYSVAPSTVSFFANESFIRLNMNFDAALRSVEPEISKSTIFSLLFFIFLVLGALNYSKVKPILVILFEILIEYQKTLNSKRKTKAFVQQGSEVSGLGDVTNGENVSIKKRSKTRKT